MERLSGTICWVQGWLVDHTELPVHFDSQNCNMLSLCRTTLSASLDSDRTADYNECIHGDLYVLEEAYQRFG